jgi:hypothetical protein
VVLERTLSGPASEGWQRWRGVMRDTTALSQLEREHRGEVARDERLP